MQITPFATDRLVLIVPPHHRLAKKRSVSIKSIQGENFIAFDAGIPTREAIDTLLRKKGIHVSIRTTNENIDTLKKAVEVGLGISIVPYNTVQEEVRKKKLVQIPFSDVALERPLGILTLHDRILSHPV